MLVKVRNNSNSMKKQIDLSSLIDDFPEAKFGLSIGKKKMPNGGNVESIKDFYANYLKSPNYKARLIKQGHTNPSEVVQQRLEQLKGMTVKDNPLLDTQYWPKWNGVTINEQQLKEDPSLSYSSTVSHEISHGLGALDLADPKQNNPNLKLNSDETNQFKTRNKLSSIKLGYESNIPLDTELQIGHDQKPSENKADLDALRYRLYKDGIYNTGTQQFNQSILNKAKAKYKNDVIGRLFNNFSDKDLIYLMNNIAQNSNNQTQDMAKSGIHIEESHKGLLHKNLGVPAGKPIPASKLKIKSTDSAAVKKRKQFALNAKKWKHDDGGDVPPIDFKKGLPDWVNHEQQIPLPGMDGSYNTLSPVSVKYSGLPYKNLNNDIAPIDKTSSYVNSTLDKNGLFEGYNWGTPTSKKPSPFSSDNLAEGLMAIDTLIPGQKPNKFYLHPQDMTWENEHPYGTKSQAISKVGTDLKPAKAKEMLNDGTAHGKKLTKKQKHYFQAVAHGWSPKADTGIQTGPGDKLSTTKVPAFNPDNYKPFGKGAQQAYDEGWYPQLQGNGSTTYMNRYNTAFNKVYEPKDGSYNNVVLVGNDNGMFDIVMRDKNGNPVMNLAKGIPLDQVNQYFTNSHSTIANRNNSIINNTNPDNDPNGKNLSKQIVTAAMEMGGEIAKKGHWIQGAVNPKHKGYSLGEEYDLSEDEIDNLINMGYKIQRL